MVSARLTLNGFIFLADTPVHIQLGTFLLSSNNSKLSTGAKTKKPLVENKLVYSKKLLPFNIKSINSVQKYLHITESYACILKIFSGIFLSPIN